MPRYVTHLVVGLGKGGAETMLYQILKYQSDPTIKYRVISLGATHYYEGLIRELGVEVIEYNFRKNPFSTLFKIYKSLNPCDTLCCWMYHANLLGYYLGRRAKIKNIIWCIRHNNLNANINNKRTLRINKFCAKHSSHVATITYNGNLARDVHEKMGYSHDNGVVVDNGCDTTEYAPIKEARALILKELKLPKEKQLILSVARNHPIKDIPTFISAFGFLKKTMPNAVAILCGKGIEPSNSVIVSLCEQNDLKLGEDVFLLELRHDIPVLMSACDLYVLHSAGEAFPNALLQAMSCECLCLTTDVGDAKRILSQNSNVVEPKNPLALSDGMLRLLSLSPLVAKILREANRRRVLECFNILNIVKQYENLF